MKSRLIIEKAGPKWTMDIWSQTNQRGCFCGGFKSEDEAWQYAKLYIKDCKKKDKILESYLEPEQLTLF